MKEQNQDSDKAEVLKYYQPENQIEVITIAGADEMIEEVTGYRNGQVVFKIHNGIITYGRIEDAEYCIKQAMIQREKIAIYKKEHGYE